MRLIDLEEFSHIDSRFSGLEVFPESWTKRHSFAQYQELPRPCSALFLVCTDIRVTFYPRGEKSVQAGKGDLVWIPSGICYHVEVEGGTESHIDTYTMNFCLYDGEGEELLVSDRIGIMAHGEVPLLERHINAISGEIHRTERSMTPEQRNFLKIKSEFYALWDAVVQSVGTDRDAYYPIRNGVEAMKNEWNQNRNIAYYAALCGISPTYFYRCFRRWAGKSPVEYRNMIRLSNAETMLRYTDMKINEISETVGYEDPFYFCRIFSAHFGISPTQYRKKQSRE